MTSAPGSTPPYLGAGLALVLTALVIQAADASSWFSLLPPAALGAVALFSLIWLTAIVALGWRGRARPGRPGAALAVGLIAMLLLSGNALARYGRLQRLPALAQEQARREVDRRADVIQEQFTAVLSRAGAPLQAWAQRLAGFDGGPSRAFEMLDAIDAGTGFTRKGGGLSLYDAAGHAIAWAGTSYPPPHGLLDGLTDGRIAWRVVAEPHLARLYALLPANGRVLVTETTLYSQLDPRQRDLALPALSGDDAAILKLQDFREPETGFANLLARKDDRYSGGATGERKLLFVGLRAPDRSFLGYARVRGLAPSDMRRAIDSWHRDAAATLVALLLAALCLIVFAPSRGGAGAPDGLPLRRVLTRLGAGLALIWGGRVVLSWFPLELSARRLDLFDSSVFASAGFFHLLRSPGDLAITSLAALASALIVMRACGRLHPAGAALPGAGWRAFAGWLLLAGLAAGAIRYVPPLAREFVSNSTASLLTVEPLTASAATLALQCSALVLLLSLFLLAEAALLLAASGGGPAASAARLLPRPGDGLSRWAVGAFLPGLLLASLLYDPLLVPPTHRANEALFEDQLMPAVLSQSESRKAMVRITIEALGSIPDLADKIQEPQTSPSSTALDLWLRTPLKDSGYNASLLVVDSEGRALSRFARNLPPAFDRRAPESYSPPGEPTIERVSFLNLTKRIWHADYYVISGDRLVGTITIHMLDDFENIPFLSAEKPYARALSPQLRRIMTLAPGSRGVRHTVYDRQGRPVFWNQREAPPLPKDWTDLLVAPGSTRWIDVSEEERPAHYLLFSDGEHLFALGFNMAAPLERLARAIRMSFLGLALCVVLLLPAGLVQARLEGRRWWPRLLQTLGRTHYRKLLTTFTAATLIPLFLLSVLMSGYITRELDDDVEDRGRQGIESAGSLVKTILETEEKAKPDDDTLYWLSLLVGEDVNLYQHGELLATSRPELFSAGLLSPRIDGRVYRRLALQGGRFAMGQETIKGDDYRTITATVLANDGNWEGFLSLPLDAQAAEALVAAREVTDAMLITFMGMVVLMGAVAYLLAGAVSRPIRSLREAAARIAAGDLEAIVEDRPRDETGELIASFNRMARAIKEQREDLERRRDYIEKILQNATIGVISMDSRRRVVTANPAVRAILGLPDLSEGAALDDLVASHDALAPLRAPLADPMSAVSHDVELTLPTPPATPAAPGAPADRTVRARLVPFLEGQGLILLLEDVTETVRSNRLAAWAEMARRIAHEIKNPLTPIQLSTEHIRRVHEEGSPHFPLVLEECLRTIMEAVADLRRISAEFSTYARIPVTRKEPVEMAEVIAEVARPYRTAPPPGVDIRLELPAGLPRMVVDRSLIARALVNLIENAMQAMPRGGTLGIRARVEAETLVVEVSDTGMGMDAASMARIFEPYFSTKDAGTGLGMAIARKAVEEHGGRIEVTSAPGRGTTMRIVLPLALTPAKAPAATGQPSALRRE